MDSQSSPKRYCKCRVRWFYSKGAFLVILWNLIINLVFSSQFPQILSYTTHSTMYTYVSAVAFVSMPISGWLADAKYGKYTIFKAGTISMFLSTVIGCVIALVQENLGSTAAQRGYCFVLGLLFLGYGTCLVTIVPLGLDQMPEASSENTMSFIDWYLFSCITGTWMGGILTDTFKTCVDDTLKLAYVQIWSFLLVTCMSFVLILNYILTPKWLTVEPKSPQALRNIYQVLTFAAKHKAPLDRSALTYWEEDVPSRLDLGKSKFGGPFTTEQVEDVKTILRIVTVSIPIFLLYTLIDLNIFWYRDKVGELSACLKTIVFYFGYGSWWWFLACTILQEFVIYPLSRGRLPSTFTKIEAVSFVFTLVVTVCSILTILDYGDVVTINSWVVEVIYFMLSGFAYQILLSSILEFACAHSPYNMRGLIFGYMVLLGAISTVFLNLFNALLLPLCETQESCHIYLWSALSVSSMLSFVLFCYAARKYKRRVRDDQYFAQVVVEEVYDRRLTAAAAHYRNYYQGTNVNYTVIHGN